MSSHLTSYQDQANRYEGHHGDERKSLAGLPDLFDKMVQGGDDPLVAVKTVVSLLAGEPGPS